MLGSCLWIYVKKKPPPCGSGSVELDVENKSCSGLDGGGGKRLQKTHSEQTFCPTNPAGRARPRQSRPCGTSPPARPSNKIYLPLGPGTGTNNLPWPPTGPPRIAFYPSRQDPRTCPSPQGRSRARGSARESRPRKGVVE